MYSFNEGTVCNGNTPRNLEQLCRGTKYIAGYLPGKDH